MTLPIKQMGGLTEAEITLAIEQSAERREAALDTKLASHRDDINKRLERTEDVVQNNNDRLMDVQSAVAVIGETNSTQTKMLETIVKQGETWHEDDLKFRETVLGRVTKIESDQATMATATETLTVQVRKLRLIGAVVYGTTRAFRFCLDKLADADIWKILAGAIILYLLHLFSPELFKIVEHMVK